MFSQRRQKPLSVPSRGNFLAKNHKNGSINKRVISRENSRLIRMTTLIDPAEEEDKEIDKDIVMKAIDQSFTRRLSNGKGQLDLPDLVFCFTLTLQSDRQIQDKLSHNAWDIVDLDQGQLPQSSSLIHSILCSKESSQSPLDKPPSLKLYQIIFPFEGRQINLLSLEDPSKFYIINLDLVQVLIDFTAAHNTAFKNELIRLKIDKTLNLDLYITNRTLPSLSHSIKTAQYEQLRIKKNQLQEYLRKIIRASRAFEFGISCISKQTDFLKKRFATEQQFVKYCQTGDIILFKDSHTMAKIQRAITGSQYDHMGIIYRSQRYGICIFESSSGLGVAMTIWNHLIRHRWYKNIEKISWRKLEYDRSPDFQVKVSDFIKANLHKKYGISLTKLLRFKSVIYTSPQEEKTRTYFCSQIVAALYKHMGLLDAHVSATQYWPKHFTDSGNLSLLKRSSLSKERELVFEGNILKATYPWFKKE